MQNKLLSLFHSLHRWYAGLGAPGVILAWFLLFVLYFCIGGLFFYQFPLSVLSGAVPRFFLSGEVFTHSFSIQCAGWALDQPTIGKYLLWFSIFSFLTLPFILTVRSFCPRETKAQNMAFSAGLFFLTFWALSILSWPVSLLVQYISSMGITFMRLAGLFLSCGSGIAWVFLAIVLSRRTSSSHSVYSASLFALAGPVIIWFTFFL